MMDVIPPGTGAGTVVAAVGAMGQVLLTVSGDGRPAIQERQIRRLSGPARGRAIRRRPKRRPASGPTTTASLPRSLGIRW